MSLRLTESLAGQPDRKDLTTEGSAVPVTVVVPEEHVVAFVSVVSGTATAASPDPDSHSPGQRGAEFSGRHHVIFSQISSGHQGFHHRTPVEARSKGDYGVNGGGPGGSSLRLAKVQPYVIAPRWAIARIRSLSTRSCPSTS